MAFSEPRGILATRRAHIVNDASKGLVARNNRLLMIYEAIKAGMLLVIIRVAVDLHRWAFGVAAIAGSMSSRMMHRLASMRMKINSIVRDQARAVALEVTRARRGKKRRAEGTAGQYVSAKGDARARNRLRLGAAWQNHAEALETWRP